MGLLAGVILMFVITLILLDSKRIQCFKVKGIICPVFTPVDENGSLDLGIVLPYAQFLGDKGVDGVVDNELAALKEAMPLVTGVNLGPIRPPEIRLTFEEVVRLEERLTEANIEIIDSALEDEKIVSLIVDCSSDNK